MPDQPQSIHLVWYKRDLRITDHGPLHKAAESGLPVLPLYIIEPSVINAPTFAPAHWAFIRQSLIELRENLAKLGQPLIVRIGHALPVLHALAQEYAIEKIWAHEETTTLTGFKRDDELRAWAAAQAIPLDEMPTNGVVRGLSLDRRSRWKNIREDRMRKWPWPTPKNIRPLAQTSFGLGHIPDHDELGIARNKRELQPAGEEEAGKILGGFLLWRGSKYIQESASPLTAPAASSRISPHLAYGTLSMRTAVREVRQQLYNFRSMSPQEKYQRGPLWVGSLRRFESRLLLRDELMQRMEWKPTIEIANQISGFNGVRPDGSSGWPSALLEAWQTGRTGYPLVDASMRFLNHSGWLNYRMRAMLVSFAAHDLWLDWRGYSPYLARVFTDFEPGVHYNQLQMLSGTSETQAFRVFDPIAEAKQQDPRGEFIRRWLPELVGVPNSHIHQPETMSAEQQAQAGCIIGRAYPAPIVNHAEAAAKAKAQIQAIRSPKVKAVDSGLNLTDGLK
ncbi:MAG: deoxyribodipyrimidine photo-lyase [Cellvibrionaceae bacterium]|jgi:deoxyribodipyrimidine photo-lyase